MRMERRTSTRLAWVVGAAAIALMIAALVIDLMDRHSGVSADLGNWSFGDLLDQVVNLATPILGVILITKKPDNRLGWMFLVAGLGLAIGAFSSAYATHALLVDPGSWPGGYLAGWFSNWIFVFPVAMLAFLFLLFPTGHLRSPKWRAAGWFVGIAYVVMGALLIVGATASWKDPTNSSGGGGGLLIASFAVFYLGGLVVSVAALVVRFKGSVGDERLQLKWFVTGALLVVAIFVVAFLVNLRSTPEIVSVLQSLAFIFLWASIGIAILKYRLYEIDVVLNKAVIYGTLAAFFVAVYVGFVVLVGRAIGSTRSPYLTLLAAAVIAIAFNPVRTRATKLANRLVYGRRATPYEVLSQFSDEMAGTYSLEEVLPRMADILGRGTGAKQARVWLRIGRELRPAATWGEPGTNEPLAMLDGEVPQIEGASCVAAVKHQGEFLGALSVAKPANEPLSSADAKLVEDMASQAGLVLRNVRLTEELRANLEELRASRQRIVTAQDAAARRLERNIHDGAQQQLVALAVKQRLAAGLLDRDAEKTKQILNELQSDTTAALENLRDLARGIYPPLLADKGLGPALEAQTGRAALPTSIEVDGVGRYPQEAEAAVYFCTLEALQNVAKYAQASQATVRVQGTNGHLTFTIADDGIGFDPGAAGYGSGLQGMSDRMAALGGELKVTSGLGAGTLVEGTLPVGGEHPYT
jgi:signal transduction histidine kinase